jgi:hypothetical protein
MALAPGTGRWQYRVGPETTACFLEMNPHQLRRWSFDEQGTQTPTKRRLPPSLFFTPNFEMRPPPRSSSEYSEDLYELNIARRRARERILSYRYWLSIFGFPEKPKNNQRPPTLLSPYDRSQFTLPNGKVQVFGSFPLYRRASISCNEELQESEELMPFSPYFYDPAARQLGRRPLKVRLKPDKIASGYRQPSRNLDPRYMYQVQPQNAAGVFRRNLIYNSRIWVPSANLDDNVRARRWSEGDLRLDEAEIKGARQRFRNPRLEELFLAAFGDVGRRNRRWDRFFIRNVVVYLKIVAKCFFFVAIVLLLPILLLGRSCFAKLPDKNEEDYDAESLWSETQRS